MLTKRVAQAVLFAALLAAVALGLPGEAQAEAYEWSTVTVDSADNVGRYTSIAVDGSGRLIISYYDDTNDDLKFATCDLSATGCDDQSDWTKVTVDSADNVGRYTSIAVDGNGDPMISYFDDTNDDLKFATCDLSATGCDDQSDWTKVTVAWTPRVGFSTSIALDADGDPMISYFDDSNGYLKFATCDLSATGCDDESDWTKVTVDAMGVVGSGTSIAVANGDAVISYHDDTDSRLKFAVCDLSATGCDEQTDWTTVTVDPGGGDVGERNSIAVANGDPVISYHDATDGDLKFAICDLSTTGCDQQTDWTFDVTVDEVENVNLGDWTSIAVANGDPVISYHDATNGNLKFAICDRSATGCDQQSDWSTETLDDGTHVGRYTSIAVGGSGRLIISYYDDINRDLKFATGSLPLPPVGGIAEYPHVDESALAAADSSGGSSSPLYAALAGAAAAGALAVVAGAWYARRRWGR